MLVVGLLIGLIVLILPVALVVLIITAIVKRNKGDKNNFEKTVRNIYIYIILIITVVAIIIGVIATFRTGLDVILPEKSVSQSTSYNTEQKERNENIIEFCTTLSLVISIIPVFIYHNKLVNKNKKVKEEEVKVEEVKITPKSK